MNFYDIKDAAERFPVLPIYLTEYSKSRYIRVLGILINVPWFIPGMVLWVILMPLLSFAEAIQDAWEEDTE